MFMLRSYSLFSLILILIIGLSACNQNSSKPSNSEYITINIDDREISDIMISDMFSEFELIRLETDTVPIGQIRKLKIFNDKIYILDRSGLFIFSGTGEILYLIYKKGKGPEEYLSISDFTVDSDENLYISDHSGKKIVRYNSKGEYEDKWDLGYYNSGIMLYDDIYYLFPGFSNMEGEGGKHMVLGYNNWKAREPALTYLNIDSNIAMYMHFVEIANFRTDNENLLLGTSGFDTIYSITKESFKPSYIFNYLNGKIPRSELNKEFADVREFSEFREEKDYCHYAFYYLDSPDMLFTNFFKGNKIYTNVYDKAANSNRSTDGFVDDVFLSNSKQSVFEFYPLAYSDSWYYFIYQPYKIIEYLDKNGYDKIDLSKVSREFLESTDEDDNPIIMKLK